MSTRTAPQERPGASAFKVYPVEADALDLATMVMVRVSVGDPRSHPISFLTRHTLLDADSRSEDPDRPARRCPQAANGEPGRRIHSTELPHATHSPSSTWKDTSSTATTFECFRRNSVVRPSTSRPRWSPAFPLRARRSRTRPPRDLKSGHKQGPEVGHVSSCGVGGHETRPFPVRPELVAHRALLSHRHRKDEKAGRRDREHRSTSTGGNDDGLARRHGGGDRLVQFAPGPIGVDGQRTERSAAPGSSAGQPPGPRPPTPSPTTSSRS